ncbi:MAG: alpha/beta hydrolase, partial [Frankiales bacterium]|nr:alpha/beta hydrolase [Frankiales bacterium]
RLGSGAVAALMDGLPKRVRDRYEIADPMALLPTGVPTLLLHSADDDLVPLSQSEAYVAAAVEAGDDSRLVRVPGGHFDHLDPTSAAGEALRTALRSVLS